MPFSNQRFAWAAAAGLLLSAPAWAADCQTQVDANDQMQFSVQRISVPKSCKSFAVTLKHVGKLPKASMGHNIVVTLPADMQAVVTEGIPAGLASDYVKADDPRVIAHSKLVGGGESTTFQIPVAKLKAGTDYSFFCSFPGHAALMKGTLALGS